MVNLSSASPQDVLLLSVVVAGGLGKPRAPPLHRTAGSQSPHINTRRFGG